MEGSGIKLNPPSNGITNFFIKNPAIGITLIYIYSSFVGAAYSKAFFGLLNIEILNFCKLEDFLGFAFKQPWVLSLSYVLLIVLYYFLRNTKFSNNLIDFVLLLATHKRGKLGDEEIIENAIDLRARMKKFLIALLLVIPFLVAINLGNSDSKELINTNRKTLNFKFVSSKDTIYATDIFEVTSEYFFILNQEAKIEIVNKDNVEKLVKIN